MGADQTVARINAVDDSRAGIASNEDLVVEFKPILVVWSYDREGRGVFVVGIEDVVILLIWGKRRASHSRRGCRIGAAGS